jgi:hypothetical protein
MIFTELFETEIPIASGVVNPATGRAWLPSELQAAQARIAAKKAQQAAQAQAARDAEKEPAPMPLATSSTAPTPTSVKYTGTLAPKKKPAPANFTQAAGTGYKLPGTPTVPTVPNMTQAPAKIAAPAEPEPITIGGQKISPSDPAYAKIMKNAPAGIASTAPQASEKIAVKDITDQVNRQLKLVKTRDDLKRIKQLIDRQFSKHGLVSESAFAKRDQLIERATKILENRSN